MKEVIKFCDERATPILMAKARRVGSGDKRPERERIE